MLDSTARVPGPSALWPGLGVVGFSNAVLRYLAVVYRRDYVGGIWRLPEGAPAQWVVYFKFDDVDAGFARARELGGELTAEPRDSPYGRWAPVRDPQGAVFRLISTNP